MNVLMEIYPLPLTLIYILERGSIYIDMDSVCFKKSFLFRCDLIIHPD
jgi:hypothetical protein